MRVAILSLLGLSFFLTSQKLWAYCENVELGNKSPIAMFAPDLAKDPILGIARQLEALFAAKAQERGSKLEIKINWNYLGATACAENIDGIAKVALNSGFLRVPSISYEGMAMIMCHEIGHHLAGAPYSHDLNSGGLSVEGQADLFATSECLPALWSDLSWLQKEWKWSPMDGLATYISTCQKMGDNSTDINLCAMNLKSIKSMMGVLAYMKAVEPPDFDATGSPTSFTLDAHPELSCRMETYVQGALCSQPMRMAGGSGPGMEVQHGCVRPTCWYKP